MRNLTPVILKLQETLFLYKVIPITFFLVSLKLNLFQPKFMFSFEANLEMKKYQFNFELVSVVSWKPFPVNDPKATMLY